MTTLFLSHSAVDRAVAERVRRWLQASGYHALFLDFDAADGIAVGRRWEAELYGRLRGTDAVVFLASASSVESRWCFAEVALARSLGRPVFPLRIDRTARLGLLDDVQWADLTEDDAGLERLRRGLQDAGLRASDSYAWDQGRSPYPGLEAFDRKDAAVFFGRDQEIERLVTLLTGTLLRGSGLFVAIVGPSGSGKSSLLRAGLLPRLARRVDRWVVVPPMQPGRQPMQELARALRRAYQAAGQDRSRAELLRRLAAGPDELVEIARELGESPDGPDRSVLLVIDQAEELVTRSGPEEQREFLGLVQAALRADGRLWAVATLRSEFHSNDPDRAGLAAVIDETLNLEPLDRARLPEVIERPARRVGLEFDQGLVQRLADDTTGGDALPLLAWTLQQLYETAERGAEHRVTTAAYEKLGGVAGALRRQADRLAAELDRHGRSGLVLPVLLKLVTLDESGAPTRRRVERGRFGPEESEILQAFVDARLLTAGGEDDAVEVAHEALLRQWPPLVDAIATEQEGLRTRSQVERWATDWDRGGRDESYLLRGSRLAALRDWLERHPDDLGPVDRQFLDASTAAADRDRRAEEERERTRRRIQAESWARGAVYEADRASPQQAVLFALAALRVAGAEQDPEVVGAVHRVLDLVRLRRVLRGHADRLGGVAVDPDGRTLLTGSYDGTARLWDVASGELVRVLAGHTHHVVCVAWSPDGTRVATGSWDRTARVWDPLTGAAGTVLAGHEGTVSSVTWSPDGTRLATGSMDKTAGVWDAATGERQLRLADHTEWVRSAEWSPDGEWLLTGSYDGTAGLWEVATGERRGTLTGHTAAVPAVHWSADGSQAVTASEDGTLRVWDVGQRAEVLAIPVSDTPLYCLDLDPTGTSVVAGGEDGTLRVFDLGSGALLEVHRGHGSWVSGVWWSATGTELVSSSGDHTAHVVQLDGRRRGRPVDRAGAWTSSVRWHPDGRRAARASGDGTIRIWVPEGNPAEDLRIEGINVLCLAWHADGVRLATGGFDGEIRVVDTERLEFVGSYPQHSTRVTAIAWQPGGSLLAMASSDGTAHVVDAGTGEVVATLAPEVQTDALAWSRDGTRLAFGGWSAELFVWSAGSGEVALLGRHTAALHDVAWGPGDRLVSTSGDGTARFWDAAGGGQVGQLPAGEAFAVGWSPDGRSVATGSRDGTARIWDVASLTRVQELPHDEGLHALDWSPDGEHLLAGGERGGLWLWDVGPAHLERELAGLAGDLLTDEEIRRLVPDRPAG